MAIRIYGDSSSDIPNESSVKNNINIIPMHVTINDKTYLDGKDLDHNTFYELLTTTDCFPKTSQLTPDSFLQHFEDAKLKGDDLIFISLSSGLSGTYQSAIIAKEIVGYEKIYIVDSLSASLGEGLLVELAVKLKNDNYSALEIVQYLEQAKKKIKVFAAVNTLEYLHKGGRLSKTQAIIGSLINIKPIITFEENGTLTVYEKQLGINRAMRSIVKAVEKFPIDENYPVYFVYTVNNKETVRLVEKLNGILNNNYKYDIYEVGPMVGTHIGPNAFGLIYITKN